MALPPATPHRGDAITVAEGHLELLAARDFTRLKRVLHCDDETCARCAR